MQPFSGIRRRFRSWISTRSAAISTTPPFMWRRWATRLFAPLELEFAPLPDRIRHIIARLGQVPLFLDQAGTNLASSPEVWTRVAIEENAGNIDLVDKTIRAKVPAELQNAYQRAAGPALAAMRKFQDFLENSLMARKADWRLGPELYNRKFGYTMATGADPRFSAAVGIP